MGNVLAHHGQRACPCWADLLSDKCPKVNVVIPIFLFSGFSRLLQFLSAEFLTSDKSFHLTITFISKPSRQLPDNRKTVIYLVVRTLQRKTRQSDSFLEILVFTENQRYEQLLLISIELIPPTGWAYISSHRCGFAVSPLWWWEICGQTRLSFHRTCQYV